MMLAIALLAAAPAPLRFEVVYRELPNLVYQLDCVSGALHACSREAYTADWNAGLVVDEGDRAALETWRAVHQRYAQRVSLDPAVPLPLGSRSAIALDARLRIAALLATSIDDFASRVDVVALPSDRAALTQVLRRFEPRFRPRWLTRAKAGQAFAAELTKTLQQPRVQALSSSFRAFYDAQVPDDRPLPFVVVDRPELGNDRSTHGEQIDGVSVLEVLPGEHAIDRLDVAIHELCHFFFFSMRPQTLGAMQAAFIASTTPGSTAAYRLFDEAMATALGNGVMARLVKRADFERRLAKPQGFYRDPDIDRSAKALLPFVDQWLAAGKTAASEGFVEGTLAALESAYGAELAAPRLALFELLLFHDESIVGDLRAELHQRFHISSLSSMVGGIDDPEIGPWYTAREVTSIFVITPAHLAGLVPLKVLSAAEAKSLASVTGPTLFGKARSAHEWVTVIIATDLAQATLGFDALAAAKAPLVGRVELHPQR